MDFLGDFEILKQLVGEALASEITKYLIAFGIAAIIHSSRVKKEIRLNFQILTEAIRDLGEALRTDLRNQSKRIEIVEKRMDKLDGSKS